MLNEEVSPKVYDREVNIAVARGDTHVVFCVAHSTVVVVSDEIEAALQSGSVGIGQLFRTYNILPQFCLLDAGRTSAGFWRTYELTSDLVRCHITERFRSDTFDLDPIMDERQAEAGRWRCGFDDDAGSDGHLPERLPGR